MSYRRVDDEEEDVVDLEEEEEEEEEEGGEVYDLDEEDRSLEEELHCSVEGLGCWHTIDNEPVYIAPSDAFECIRDLLRAFREDVGTSRRVHRLLGKWDVVRQKLVPMLISHRDDLDDKCFQILKLLVILTMPVNKDTPELDTHLQYLQNYKTAIGVNEDVLTIFMTILDKCVTTNLTITQQQQTDNVEVAEGTRRLRLQQQELVFTLVRNLLEIPDPRPGDPGFNPTHQNLQMTMLQELYESGFLDFAVLVIEDAISGPTPSINRNKHLIWLYFEILYHACAKIRPKDLITIDARFKPDLTALINKSIETNAASLPIMTRHNRFGKRVPVNMPEGGGNSSNATKQLISGRQRHYRNKLVDEAPNVFQDRTFTDVDVGCKVPISNITSGAGAGTLEVSSLDGGVTTINLAVWEKFLKSFASFVVDMVDRVFAGIMTAVIKAITDTEQEQEYDVVRALNFIAWALDFQRQSHEYHVAAINRDRELAIAKATQTGTPLPPPLEITELVIDITSVEPALNVEATELVARQLRVHSKEAKSLKKGGARNVVVLRALLEQIRMIRTCLRSPDKETSHVAEMLLSNVLYEDVQTQLVWLCKTGFKSTVADPRVLTLSVQCLAELLKAMEKVMNKTGNKYKFAAGKRRRRKKGKSKKNKSNKSKSNKSNGNIEGGNHEEAGGSSEFSDGDDREKDEEEEDDSDDSGVDNYDNIRAADTSQEAILMDLAHTDTINNLMYMLGDGYITNGTLINSDCVYLLSQMISLRVIVVAKQPCNIAFFFQLSHLIVFHKILTDPKIYINQKQHHHVIKFCSFVSRRFLQTAMKNSCVYVEAIFPKLRGGRGGQLMSMEAEFNGILTDYNDDDSKDILQRMHEGEAYEAMKAAASGKVLEEVSSGPSWSDDEDDLLRRLWDDYKHAPDRYGIIAINLPVHDNGYERSATDVKRRLAEIGIATRQDINNDDEDEEAAHEGVPEGSGRSDEEEEDEDNDTDDDEEEDGFDIDRIRRQMHDGERERNTEGVMGGNRERHSGVEGREQSDDDEEEDGIGFSEDEEDEDEEEGEEEEEERGNEENIPSEANRVEADSTAADDGAGAGDDDIEMHDVSNNTDTSDDKLIAGLGDNLPQFDDLRQGLNKLLDDMINDDNGNISSYFNKIELDILGPEGLAMLENAVNNNT